MATLVTLFKIQDSATGLFSMGGYNPRWTREGKVWKTRAQLVAHLKLYRRGQYEAERKTIPVTWVVVELKLSPVKRTRAATLVK